MTRMTFYDELVARGREDTDAVIRVERRTDRALVTLSDPGKLNVLTAAALCPSLWTRSPVKFGTAEVTSFTVESATSITATAPPGTGTVNVTVTTPAGTSPTSAADRYTYQAPPTITTLSTKSGPAAGGTTVTITGTEFATATKVAFGSTSAVEFTVNSPTSITAVAPPALAGTVDVSVTNIAGTSASSTKDRFKYLPTVEGVTPNTGSTLGGTGVTVTGSGFALGSTATTFVFGKVKAKSVNCTSSTTCTMTTPAQVAGTVDVKATVNKAISPINPGDQFTYS